MDCDKDLGLHEFQTFVPAVCTHLCVRGVCQMCSPETQTGKTLTWLHTVWNPNNQQLYYVAGRSCVYVKTAILSNWRKVGLCRVMWLENILCCDGGNRRVEGDGEGKEPRCKWSRDKRLTPINQTWPHSASHVLIPTLRSVCTSTFSVPTWTTTLRKSAHRHTLHEQGHIYIHADSVINSEGGSTVRSPLPVWRRYNEIFIPSARSFNFSASALLTHMKLEKWRPNTDQRMNLKDSGVPLRVRQHAHVNILETPRSSSTVSQSYSFGCLTSSFVYCFLIFHNTKG